MIALYLGALAGTCIYAALHHLHLGLRLRSRWPHWLIAFAGVAFAVLALLAILPYRDPTLATARFQQKAALAIGFLGALALYWFVGLRAGLSRRLLHRISVLISAAVLVDLLAPAGLLIENLRGFMPIALPWGEVYQQPIADPSPLRWFVMLPAVLVPLGCLGYAILLLWQKGHRGEVLALLAIAVLPAVPLIINLVVPEPGGLPLPLGETTLAAGMVLLSLFTAGDMAEAAALESGIERSEARLHALVDTSPEAIGLYDPIGGGFVAVNRRLEQLLGRTEAELASTPLDSLLREILKPSAPGVDQGHGLLERALAGDAVVEEVKVRGSAGYLVPCELRLSALESNEGRLVRVSLLDVSDRRRAERERAALEARLDRLERLETLGTLAGGIAHDLNNMLTPVAGYTELAAAELEDHPAGTYMDEIRAAVRKAHKLTHDILTFSRRAEGPMESVHIQPAVAQSVELLRATLPSRIRLHTELAAAGASVFGDPTQLQQVIMSLGSNAAAAMPRGGELRITLRATPDSVDLEVADTGIGMDAETAARSFDPFFTTRGLGRASGLGLSVVHGIVTSWGGVVDLETALGEGTTVRVSLPRPASVSG
jgi:PAS domain S-box-containing protein